jgi:hypothetical protein
MNMIDWLAEWLVIVAGFAVLGFGFAILFFIVIEVANLIFGFSVSPDAAVAGGFLASCGVFVWLQPRP